MIEHIASKGKPVILAAGASSMDDVHRAVEAATNLNPQFVLMQCNTNYTGSLENFKYIQLNVLRSFQTMYPKMILGLSDHTPGHSTVLGAVALGARVIEKHFTDDVNRTGPDHAFSMDPKSWKEMVERTRELEIALGNGIKKIEDNEMQTAILQRRAIRFARDLPAGQLITKTDLEVLRPCPVDGLPPYRISDVLGKKLRRDAKKGEHLTTTSIE
jgi:N-acetylneuraminate synthase